MFFLLYFLTVFFLLKAFFLFFQTVTPEQLFILFGVYGDVIRVKILFNKKDNALIQYSDIQQAQLAIQHLDKLKWNGRNIRVTASKHTLVQMPKEGQPDAGLTKEFTNSSLHRFKKPGSKNYMVHNFFVSIQSNLDSFC
ncbi:unnamed protein product [Meloidogyne enterolobii]|uniref:Uncharacterized protein n=1 Tax=Meloidogyne enterolobii TaxID=390850 RepID=A0ACB0YB12_MELEN